MPPLNFFPFPQLLDIFICNIDYVQNHQNTTDRNDEIYITHRNAHCRGLLVHRAGDEFPAFHQQN